MINSLINKIFSGKVDGEVHSEFIKFGKGIYENRYLLNAKKQKDSWNIKTGPEFANFLVKKGLEKAPGNVEIKGVIVSTLKIDEELGFPIKDVKQFMGIKQLVINTNVDPRKLIDIMNKYPKVFYALSFTLPGYELKIKAKAPKSAKPAAGGGKEPKADFCSLKTYDNSLIDDLFFDKSHFKEISIKHTLKIDSITLPKDTSDPNEIREKAIRKGSIIRIISADGKEEKKEVSFEA